MDSIHNNLWFTRQRIVQACRRAKRDPASVKLLGVTKYASDDAVRSMMEAGMRCFGENRVQQAVCRMEQFSGVEWHLIGTLQTNKVKQCRGFSLIHSLDRWSLAKEINRRAQEWGEAQDVLVQVNIAQEETKHGLAESKVMEFVRQVQAECPFVRIRGLMMMAPYVTPEETRPYFRQTRVLYDKLRTELALPWDTLSMGMSNDFEVAIEEGATLIRVGTALFAAEED